MQQPRPLPGCAAASALLQRNEGIAAPRKGKRPPGALAVLLCRQASRSAATRNRFLFRETDFAGFAADATPADDRRGVALAP
jgi:hypothetical protein